MSKSQIHTVVTHITETVAAKHFDLFSRKDYITNLENFIEYYYAAAC